jgi:hypothetical protein
MGVSGSTSKGVLLNYKTRFLYKYQRVILYLNYCAFKESKEVLGRVKLLFGPIN